MVDEASLKKNQARFRALWNTGAQEELAAFLQTVLETPHAVRCYRTTVPTPSQQLKNKLGQASDAPEGLLCLSVADEAAHNQTVDALTRRWGSNAGWAKSVSAVAIGYSDDDQPRIATVVECRPTTHGARVKERLFPAVEIRQTDPFGAAVPTGPPTLPPTSVPVELDLELDERTRRMIVLAVASSPAVMLVGPPGTGKTRLLEWVLEEARANPQAFGFTARPNEGLRVTPDESWTTRELVGGVTLDEGKLRYRPGHLLRAIAEDRWLILDEANRADMDRIFGALLTWLSSDRPVDLGAASTEAQAANVDLGWARGPRSTTENLHVLAAASTSGMPTISFRAGTEWRLLGTYNALDAQRVFRFGHALGRRFARVPVPALEPARFRVVLEDGCDGLPDYVASVIGSLYEAHHADPTTQLGHAIFMVTPPEYVRRGLASAPDASATLVHQLLAEAYLLAVGTWLAAMDEADLANLGERIEEGGQFPREQWDWVCQRLGALR